MIASPDKEVGSDTSDCDPVSGLTLGGGVSDGYYFTGEETSVAPCCENSTFGGCVCKSWNRSKEARSPKRKVGRTPCRACYLRQDIQPD
jgi:hypothetical protein